MDPCMSSPSVVHLMIVCITLVNAVLNAWLVNRRRKADTREHKRNGGTHAQRGSAAIRSEPSEGEPSTWSDSPKG